MFGAGAGAGAVSIGFWVRLRFSKGAGAVTAPKVRVRVRYTALRGMVHTVVLFAHIVFMCVILYVVIFCAYKVVQCDLRGGDPL